MFAIAVEAPEPDHIDTGAQSEEEFVRHESIVRHTILKNLFYSTTTFLAVMAVSVATLVYIFRFTNAHLAIAEAQTSAKIVGMAKGVHFTGSLLSCDYEDPVAVDWQDGPYPPIFGNTDVAVLAARIRKINEAAVLRKSASIKSSEEDSDSAEKKTITCKPPTTTTETIKTAADKLANSNVTIFKVTKCTMDRRDEADAFVGTVAMLSRLRHVTGIPRIVDFFEEGGAVYCAVSPLLVQRLDAVRFEDEESALLACRLLLDTIEQVHSKGLVLLNVGLKTVFISKDTNGNVRPFIEPPSQPLLIDDHKKGTFTLQRGMILPKLNRSLDAGGQYHKSLDYFMALRAINARTHKDCGDKIRQCMRLFTRLKGATRYSKVGLEDIRSILGTAAPDGQRISVKLTKDTHYTLRDVSVAPVEDADGDGVPDVKDEGEEEFEILERECALPVYDQILDMFRQQPNSHMDDIAP